MKKYIDLHLKPKNGEYSILFGEAKRLGYSCVGTTASVNPGVISKLDVVTRVDLEPRHSSGLLEQLRNLRSRFEIIAVKCLSKDVARQAARDHRVDILLFSEDLNIRREARLDTQEAQLASEAGCSYEVNISELIFTRDVKLSRLANVIKRELAIAKRFDIPIILSSGASTVLGLREPKALAAMTILLNVSEEDAVEMQTTTPERLLRRNRAKLSEKHITQGVRRISDAC